MRSTFALIRSVLYPLTFVYCANLIWQSQIVSTGRGMNDFVISLGYGLFAIVLFIVTILLFIRFNKKKYKANITNPLIRLSEPFFLIAGLIIAHFYYNAAYDRFQTNVRLRNEFNWLEWMDVSDSTKAYYPLTLEDGKRPFFKFKDWIYFDDTTKYEATKQWVINYEQWITNSGARYRKTPLTEFEIDDMSNEVIDCVYTIYKRTSFDSDFAKRNPSNAYSVTALCIYRQYSLTQEVTKLYFSSSPYFDLNSIRNRPSRLL